MSNKFWLWARPFSSFPACALTIVSFLSAIGLVVVSAVMLWEMRIDAARYSANASRSFLKVLEVDIARNIEIYDLTLQSAADGMKLPGIASVDRVTRQLLLFDRAGTAKDFGRILILDETGNITLSSGPIGNYDLNFSDRSYFKKLKESRDNILSIEGPIVSRINGAQSLVFCRRISTEDGSFAGAVVGTINLNYFKNLFDSIGNHLGILTLYGPDGNVLMREPNDDSLIGVNVATTLSYQRILKNKGGSFEGHAMIGEGIRHYEYLQIGKFPLRLTLSVAPDEIYAGWWRRARALGVIVIGLCLLNVVLIWLFRREIIQRKSTEMELVCANKRLQQVATTDALTGLNNRRRFDEVLARDLRRCQRQGFALSLILVDADFFKGYNDLHGHQRGDEALKLIARAARESLGRPSDTAHRIGGEEFAIILPETDASGAAIVANRLREAVASNAMPHPASPHRVVTVSCGVAELIAADMPSSLTNAADLALYEAKRMGRNCMHTAARQKGHLFLVS